MWCRGAAEKVIKRVPLYRSVGSGSRGEGPGAVAAGAGLRPRPSPTTSISSSESSASSAAGATFHFLAMRQRGMAAPASASARPHQRKTDEQREKERKEKERRPGRAALRAFARVLLRCEGCTRFPRYICGRGWCARRTFDRCGRRAADTMPHKLWRANFERYFWELRPRVQPVGTD
ncbi:unnamed protein product, partial [Iphiclides podalirius]